MPIAAVGEDHGEPRIFLEQIKHFLPGYDFDVQEKGKAGAFEGRKELSNAPVRQAESMLRSAGEKARGSHAFGLHFG